ncbi:MAG: zinc ribbon domain-containing protein [Opitutus sp.]|nr:zinc ribbon domain-containing protein [Opitutus sp.]
MPERPPSECANCGAEIPRGAKACPGCGADERTGWREASVYDGLDLPEAAFHDENETVPRPAPRSGVPWYWLLTAALLLVLCGLGFVVFR